MRIDWMKIIRMGSFYDDICSAKYISGNRSRKYKRYLKKLTHRVGRRINNVDIREE